MKVNKRKFSHWISLTAFSLNVLIALIARPFRGRSSRKERITLYGHKLNGNLLAIYHELRTSHQEDLDVVFVTMDPAYHRQLIANGIASVLATSRRLIMWLSTTDAIITSHGLHALLPLLFVSDIKFFDVWHGIPFKGFDADDFRVQHRYDEVWVASPAQRVLYIDRFGFAPNIVHATGYARTDRLVRRDEDSDDIKRGLGLDPSTAGKIVLFAPTWKQDVESRRLFPFGIDQQIFFAALSKLGRRLGATFLVRAHLNSVTVADLGVDRVVQVPHAHFPDTEAILLASDILVCDWSSIAFDYLVLDRPTIFLDVEAPFAKGLSLDASHRFGAIARNMDELLQLLERFLVEPERYAQEFSTRFTEVKARVYADYADGNASARCVARLGEQCSRASR